MLIGKKPDIPSSAITSRDEYVRYQGRRRFLRTAAKTAAVAGAAVLGVERVAERCTGRYEAADGEEPADHDGRRTD